MNQIIILCLGVVLLTFLIPSQVYSQSTPKYNATSTTLGGQNASSPSNPGGAPLVTTSTNSTTVHGHAEPLYSSSAFFLILASMLHVCC